MDRKLASKTDVMSLSGVMYPHVSSKKKKLTEF